MLRPVEQVTSSEPMTQPVSLSTQSPSTPPSQKTAGERAQNQHTPNALNSSGGDSQAGHNSNDTGCCVSVDMRWWGAKDTGLVWRLAVPRRWGWAYAPEIPRKDEGGSGVCGSWCDAVLLSPSSSPLFFFLSELVQGWLHWGVWIWKHKIKIGQSSQNDIFHLTVISVHFFMRINTQGS